MNKKFGDMLKEFMMRAEMNRTQLCKALGITTTMVKAYMEGRVPYEQRIKEIEFVLKCKFPQECFIQRIGNIESDKGFGDVGISDDINISNLTVNDFKLITSFTKAMKRRGIEVILRSKKTNKE